MLILVSCIGGQGGVRSSRSGIDKTVAKATGQNGGHGATSGENGSGEMNGDTLDDILKNGRAEIRYIVDPIDGTYKSKVTIPKNFTGLLYIAGINITSLRDKLVQVRFNFGREMEPITIPAIIARGQGILPQTDIEVVAMQITDHPFANIRLFYDLFDYTNYTASSTAVSDPRDSRLYCRGLRLEQDPTASTTAVSSCASGGDKCLYSYAKIVDSGLNQTSSGIDIPIPGAPSEPQINLGQEDYSKESLEAALKKCLPDDYFQDVIEKILYVDPGVGAATHFSGGFSWGQSILFPGGQSYKYKGPFYSFEWPALRWWYPAFRIISTYSSQ